MSRHKWKVGLKLMGRPQTATRHSWSKWIELPDGTLHYKQPMPGRTYTRADYPPRGRGRGESLLSPRRIEAKLRALEVYRLHVQGRCTFKEIGAMVGLSPSGAYRAMRRLLDRQAWDDRRRRELGIRQYSQPSAVEIDEAINRLSRELAEMENQ